MVHLEAKSEYIERLNQSSILKPIVDEILYEEAHDLNVDNSNAYITAVNLFICIKKNDKSKAEEVYNQFSKRQPTRDSHWIYDSFIVFAIVCAVRKFMFPNQWVRDVIDLSYLTSTPVEKTIKDTFKNILSGNYNVNQDFHQISIVYQHLAGSSSYENDLVNKMYGSLWRLNFPFFESDFLNVVSLKAIEISFKLKGLLSPDENYQRNEFIQTFTIRVRRISTILSWIFLIMLSVLVYYILWEITLLGDTNPFIAKAISFFIGVIGVGISAFFGLQKYVTSVIERLLFYGFGFRSTAK